MERLQDKGDVKAAQNAVHTQMRGQQTFRAFIEPCLTGLCIQRRYLQYVAWVICILSILIRHYLNTSFKTGLLQTMQVLPDGLFACPGNFPFSLS
jgi:hypothetical protein